MDICWTGFNELFATWFQQFYRKCFRLWQTKYGLFFQSNLDRFGLIMFKILWFWILNWWNHVMNVCISFEHTQPYSSNFWGAVCTITELAKRGFHTHHFPSSHGRFLLLEKIANTPATGKLKNRDVGTGGQGDNPLPKILAGIEIKTTFAS